MDLEQLEKLNDLKEKGILTQEEFDEKKKELLNGSNIAEAAKAAMPTDGTTDFSHLDLIKGAFNAFISSFKRWNDFKGRTSRFDFFGAMSFINLSWVLLSILLALRGDSYIFITIVLVLTILVFCVSLTLSVRRLHDINRSGWWVLTIIVPLVFMFFKGDVEVNRFGSAAGTDEKKANGALVLAIFFTIVVNPLLLGAFNVKTDAASSLCAKFTQFVDNKVKNRRKIFIAMDQVQTMVTNIRTLFVGQRSYAGLTMENAHTMGIFSDKIWDPIDRTATNPFGGTIVIGTANEQRFFSIASLGLPRDACVTMASADWGDSSSGFVSIAINPHQSQNYVFNSAVSKKSAKQACRSSNNAIVWTYR